MAVCITALSAFAAPTKGQTTIHGFFKAVAKNNRSLDMDGKFEFKETGRFTFTRKTATETIVTTGDYTDDGTTIKLSKGKEKTPWPEFWPVDSTLAIQPNGDLLMGTQTYAASLIGKAFTPGLYLCPASPINHYYFSAAGGYKYKGQAVSTGEYWVEKGIDPTTSQETVTLVLNILRIDGKRVSFHQIVQLDPDGGFTLEKKFKYKLASQSVVEGKSVSRPAPTADTNDKPAPTPDPKTP
ncbi:MAG TPA: hypothetical protein VGL56_10660 [Fimbriimonadaceae bacterium]